MCVTNAIGEFFWKHRFGDGNDPILDNVINVVLLLNERTSQQTVFSFALAVSQVSNGDLARKDPAERSNLWIKVVGNMPRKKVYHPRCVWKVLL